MPKYKNQLFDHGMVLYDKGIGIGSKEGVPTIIFGYPLFYKEDIEIKKRSGVEIYYTTEYFWDYLNLAKLIGPFNNE